MSAEWNLLADPQEAAEAAAGYLVGKLAKALDSRPFATLALSGGGGAQSLLPRLAALPCPWARVHFFWTDERCVPPLHTDSNFRLARELLLGPVGIPDSNIHRILGELDPSAAASRYAAEIRQFFALGPEGLPCFDMVHLGLGADGHTASLFPGEPLLEDRSGVAAPVYVEKRKSWRVTLLPGALLAAQRILFFATGAEKAEAIRALRCEKLSPQRRPAQLISHYGAEVAWFLDQAAGKLFPPPAQNV